MKKLPLLLVVTIIALPLLVLQAIVLVLLALGLPLFTIALTSRPEILAGAGALSLVLLFAMRGISSEIRGDITSIVPLLGLILWIKWRETHPRVRPENR